VPKSARSPWSATCRASWGAPTSGQPVCTATDLTPKGTSYSRTFTVPAGKWELKVAIDHSWDESYGAEGGGSNIPPALTSATKLLFTYVDTTHLETIKPVDLPGSRVPPTGRWRSDRCARRSPGSGSTF